MEVIKGENQKKELQTKDLYVPLSKLPSANNKFDLTKEQKYWYKYFGEMLVATKKLVKPDLLHLHRLSRSVDYYLQAEEKIQALGYEGGLIQTFKGGATNISGHVTIREKMLKEIDQLSKHFGFSFLDRKKLAAETSTPENQISLFDEFKSLKSVGHGGN